MPIDPCTLIHRWFEEVWNQGREETVDELFAEHSVGHGLGEGDVAVHGPDEFKVFLRNMRSALPDIHMEIKDTIATADSAVVRIAVTGTHLGEGIGLAPTGRPVSFSGIVIVKVKDGQIIEGWNSWDQLGLLRQLGVVPTPEKADRFLTSNA